MPEAERARHPIPYGWYAVGFGDELAVGEIRSLRYFGRDLVLFRGESGAVAMIDANCPHQGYHLGKGGKVDGELIRCPFHSWGFDAEGWCRDIPYAPVMPKLCYRQALTRGYPVREADGVVWAWYHPQGVAPLFDIEAHAEFGDPAWAQQTRFAWRRAIDPRDMAEAMPFVHGALGTTAGGQDVYEGHVRHTSAEAAEATLRSVTSGPGCAAIRLDGSAALLLLVLMTPVESDDVEVRFAFTHSKAEAGSPALAVACGRLSSLTIRDNDVGHASAMSGDFQRWFEQFWVYDEALAQAAAE